MKRVGKYCVLLALAMPLMASADDQFFAAKRDVSVMGQILSSAFGSDYRHTTQVDSIYLAHQGAVFIVHVSPFMRIRTGGNLFYINGSGDNMPLPPLPPTLSADDAVSIGETAPAIAMPEVTEQLGMGLDTQTRDALRAISRQLGDVDQQLSDARIQLLHADKDAERKKLQLQVEQIEQQRDTVEHKGEVLREKIRESQKKFEKARRDKLEKARTKLMKTMVHSVMDSLCNYGSTLKHLADNEHVSVILEGAPDDTRYKVFVMNKQQVTDCRHGADALMKSATEYSY